DRALLAEAARAVEDEASGRGAVREAVLHRRAAARNGVEVEPADCERRFERSHLREGRLHAVAHFLRARRLAAAGLAAREDEERDEREDHGDDDRDEPRPGPRAAARRARRRRTPRDLRLWFD